MPSIEDQIRDGELYRIECEEELNNALQKYQMLDNATKSEGFNTLDEEAAFLLMSEKSTIAQLVHIKSRLLKITVAKLNSYPQSFKDKVLGTKEAPKSKPTLVVVKK